MEGMSLGISLGAELGTADGTALGDEEGIIDGTSLGMALGSKLGITVGNCVGDLVKTLDFLSEDDEPFLSFFTLFIFFLSFSKSTFRITYSPSSSCEKEGASKSYRNVGNSPSTVFTCRRRR
jgi:hypothetical protein